MKHFIIAFIISILSFNSFSIETPQSSEFTAISDLESEIKIMEQNTINNEITYSKEDISQKSFESIASSFEILVDNLSLIIQILLTIGIFLFIISRFFKGWTT